MGLGQQGLIKNTAGMIYEAESAYNYIQVLEEGGYRFLRLNEGQGMHSIWHADQYYFGGPWSQPLVATFFNDPVLDPTNVERIAILGLAGGTTARQASLAYPDAQVDGWEIDPEIIRVGEEWFGMDLPNLNAVAEDARWGISHSETLYDVISIDAYRPPYIPPHMVTVEFFAEVAKHLTDKGAIAINVGRSPDDRSLLNAMTSTVAVIFPNVFVMDIPDSYNSVLFATKNYDSSWANFQKNLESVQSAQPGGLLDLTGQLTLEGKAKPKMSTLVFTDDQAPIEAITNRMVLNFLSDDSKEFE
jgi:trans-aconitate methyltransferase